MGSVKSFNIIESHNHMCGRDDSSARTEAESLSFAPTVKCGVCGAMAASRNDVCTTVDVFREEQLS